MNIGDRYICIKHFANDIVPGAICEIISLDHSNRLVQFKTIGGVNDYTLSSEYFFTYFEAIAAKVPINLPQSTKPPTPVPQLSSKSLRDLRDCWSNSPFIVISESLVYADMGIPTQVKSSCECGAHAINVDHHSSWCPLNGRTT